jgi:hypothetical protein
MGTRAFVVNGRGTDNGKATAKAVAGEHCGGEADFSTALLARTRAASVEMTVPEISEKKDNGDGQ